MMKALITGASSGIGRDMAVYLSEIGYDLIVVARNESKLTKLKSELKTNVEIFICDLSKPECCFQLYEEFKNTSIDILINNAGFGVFGEFLQTDLFSEIEMINTNIKAVHILTKLFLRDFVKRNKGYILNVSSSAGFMMGPLFSSYYASKAYVLRLTQAIQRELKESESAVKISVLCPGPVETDFDKNANINTSLNGLSSKYVAKYAIDNMFKGKPVIIPGVTMKFSVLFSKFLPQNFLSKITYVCQKKKK